MIKKLPKEILCSKNTIYCLSYKNIKCFYILNHIELSESFILRMKIPERYYPGILKNRKLFYYFEIKYACS